MGMTRIDICSAMDEETIARLQTALGELGFVADDNWHDSPIGVGLSRYRCDADEVSVFIDAWSVDLAGPELAVQRIVSLLSN